MQYLGFIVALSSLLSVVSSFQFGDQVIDDCVTGCFSQVMTKQPEAKACAKPGSPGYDIGCLCNEYLILDVMQSCLNQTNDCMGTRVDSTDQFQYACDDYIYEQAVANEPNNATDDNTPSTGSSTNNGSSDPTSLAEAEAALGPSAYALINSHKFRLSTGAKAGIGIGATVFILLMSFVGLCCFRFQFRKHQIRKMNEQIALEYSPTSTYSGDDKPKRFSRFHGSKGNTDVKDMGYGLDKELGLMISAPSNPRKYTTTKLKTVDLPKSEFKTMPRAPAPVASLHRSMSSKTARKMSLGRVEGPQRPSLCLSSPTIVLPQSTVDDYTTPRNSVRMSSQSVKQQHQSMHLNTDIPLMFFTPATPQMNTSPISPSNTTSIYGYYSRDSIATEGDAIGIAQTVDESPSASPQPYDPTDNDYTRRTPSPAYTPYASQGSSPLSYDQKRDVSTPESHLNLASDPRAISPSNTATSRMSSPSPSQNIGAGLHMPPRYAPYTAPAPPSGYSPSPAPSTEESSKPVPEMVDLSAYPATINRANSASWRLSVERAADKAMDRVRHAPCEDVPEEEERLTRSELSNTMEDVSGDRGRRKWRKQSQGSIAHTSHREKSRSGSIGVSPSDGNRRTSNASAGGYRRSSSLGGYRARTGSLNYNQIDGVPPRVGARGSSRRGSNSSVMMI